MSGRLPVSTHDDVIVQHLIDPELCIRCNTCEETCPSNAISNDLRNYVVDVDICNGCQACVSPCPTGAINSWRPVLRQSAYTREQQFAWSALPEAPSDPALDAVPPGRGRGDGSVVVENRFTPARPALARVVENRCVTPRADAAVHHIVLDVSNDDFPFLEGQSVGVLARGVDAQGARHAMRLYSVACSRDGEEGVAGRLALTVKRVIENRGGEEARGICSNYLCDLTPGDAVELAGPYGADFLMPDDTTAPLIMICTGTGVAPMRAMLDRSRALPAPLAPKRLFYGGRTPQEMAYFDELQTVHGATCDIGFALSRQAGESKRYVQDLLRERHDVLAQLLARENTHVYLCGLRGMEAGVFEALAQVCERHGLNWQALEAAMTQQRRLHVETY
nr:4Fe-4S binding protein [Paraburkholderia unamae]